MIDGTTSRGKCVQCGDTGTIEAGVQWQAEHWEQVSLDEPGLDILSLRIH